MTVQMPCDSFAAPCVRELLEWFKSLTDQVDRRVVIGQYITRNANNSNSYDAHQAWERFYLDVFRLSGEFPGLVGFDVSGRNVVGAGNENRPSDSNWREYALQHHEQGGLLRLMWHASNPWTLETSWSSIPEGHQLEELITPGNSVYERWNDWLSVIADIIAQYAEKDIPVIWGPLHEMNGRWFWWGTGATDQLLSVWQHMFRYFTETRGLHNVLWMFCPDAKASLQRALEQYPGNEYVDIIAPDLYYDSDDVPANSQLYDEFSDPKYGKVLGWGEVGINMETPIDNLKYLDDIRSRFPLVTLYMQWGDVVSGQINKRYALTSNNHIVEVMSDPWAITRSELVKLKSL
ncbi:glycosyl hydrolase [Paenibacillus sp. RC67]|uniref:glycoside hydrolase family 26 protein n=1 Tax=Paenibacillus sp. RC67 TaxID=3039392 RepID=UPI0024AE4F3C|nr:glycosyl hydrolase [Paenibacillus sp. RC67]